MQHTTSRESRWRPPAVVRSWAPIFLVGFLLSAAIRGLFYALYRDGLPDGVGSDVLQSFLIGARFDLAATAMALMPAAALALIPLCGRAGLNLRKTILGLAIGMITGATLLGVGDCLYYAHAAKRVSYEPLVLWGSGSRLFEFAFDERPVLLTVSIVLILGCAWFLYRRIARTFQVETPSTGRRISIVAYGLFIAALLVFLARGGHDRLRTGDAYFTTYPVVNHATLNSLVSFVHALGDDRAVYSFLPEETAVAKVRSLVSPDGTAFLSDEYPLLRRSVRTESALTPEGAPPLNLCVILVESLSAEVIGFFGNPYGATPNLDQLMKESVVFDQFYSSGSRSSHGLFATLFSVPALLGSPVMHTSLILNRFRGLPTILREQGYSTQFIYGGVYEFTNAAGVLRHAGFEDIVGEPLPDDPHAELTSWGYHDGPMFDRLLHELSRPADGPRLTVFFTQSMHNRDLPDHADKETLKKRFPKKMESDQFYRLLAYTDDCLGRFLAAAREREFHKNTVYLLLADHTNHKNQNLYHNYRIPFLIHAPGRLDPEVISTTGSQTDVLPTALGLLGISADHAAFGLDLRAEARNNAPGGAFLSLGDSFGWAEGQWILQDFVDRDEPRLSDRIADPYFLKEAAPDHPEITKRLSEQARAYLQIARQLLLEDRICGDADSP